MMEQMWIDYPQLQPEKEIIPDEEDDQSDDDEPPILHRFGDVRTESPSVSVKIIETPSTFLSELVSRAKSKVLSLRSRNESLLTPKIPSQTSAFKPVSNLGKRIDECVPTESESAANATIPAGTKKTLFRKITKEESDLMSAGGQTQKTLSEVLTAYKEMNQADPEDKNKHEMTTDSVTSSMSAGKIDDSEAVAVPSDDPCPPKTNKRGRPKKEHQKPEEKEQQKAAEESVLLPMQRSRRASTVANSVASKSLFAMNVSVKKRRKRSSNSSDVENEMSPVAKREASTATESPKEAELNSFSTSDTVQKRKRRRRPLVPKVNKRNNDKKGNCPSAVESPRLINTACPWTPVGDPVAMNVRFQNDQSPKRRWCFSSVRHKDLDIVISTFDAISVGIEKEVDGRLEKASGIAKVSSFFYDDHGNLLINIFWYYSDLSEKECKDAKEKEIKFHERELLASKHVDVIPVEAIEGHAYVLTASEYNRFVADCMLHNRPDHLRSRREEICPMSMESYPNERALPPELSPDSVYFSRYAYNFVHHRLYVGPQTKKHKPWGRSSKSKRSPSRTF